MRIDGGSIDDLSFAPIELVEWQESRPAGTTEDRTKIPGLERRSGDVACHPPLAGQQRLGWRGL